MKYSREKFKTSKNYGSTKNKAEGYSFTSSWPSVIISYNPWVPVLFIDNVFEIRKMGEESLFVFAMVLSKKPVRVLTFLHEEQWYLPRFEYETDYPYSSSECVRDLENALDSTGKFRFDVVAELFPRNDDSLSNHVNPNGLNRLTLLDALSEEQLAQELPPYAKWNTVEDTIKIARDDDLGYYYGYAFSAVLSFLRPYAEPMACHTDPRATERWTHRAVHYLLSVIRNLNLEATSDVTRVAWDSTSEMFRVNTCEGWYYLKAPHPGCPEVRVTRWLSENFPHDTLEVVGVDDPLNCFVAKGVHPVLQNGPHAEKIIWKKLARMQQKLVEHVTDLKEMGVPDYSAGVLLGIIDQWVLDPDADELIRGEGMTGEELSYILKKVCRRLENSTIPPTLVHGDFALRNFGKRHGVTQDDGYILYDWGWSYIGHPFSDCRFEFYKGDNVKEYQCFWLDYTPTIEIEKEWTFAAALGWMGQMGNAIVWKELGTRLNRRLALFLLKCAVSKLVDFVKKNRN